MKPIVFAKLSGIDAQIGLVMAWEDSGSCLNIFRMRNHGRNVQEVRVKSLVAQVSEIEWIALYLRNHVDWILELESSWQGRTVDHVLTYSGWEITVGSQKRSRIESQKRSRSTSQKSCCVSERNRSVRFVFAKPSGFDARIGVSIAWKERGSCLNIFQMRNHIQI
ncbi:uncharacterized protein G2W53_041223 [Senna tora]|uniref:Uncharacterized protein n=1 Tax=Senna tora TaxID=362788 RepID=A0A834SJL8_9FABA|nr:uncharacterized protein G2W53_041223 [Senna tora]